MDKTFYTSLAIAIGFVSTVEGCGTPQDQQKNGVTGAGGSTSGGSEAPPPCPAGQVLSEDGSCMAIGIQGCAAKFIDSDGICRPSMAKCADEPGTIPKFDEGCVPVGIPKANCAPEFWDATEGLCRPTMAKCADKPGTFAVPSLGCVSIDGPNGCGDGPWGNIIDGPNVRYVDKSYAGQTSDGTKDKPYKTIAAAVASVPEGSTVAIAAGDYVEDYVLNKSLTLEGRCASMVHIASLTPEYSAAFVGAANVVVRSVTMGGPDSAVWVLPGKSALIERVHIREATGSGIHVSDSASITIRDSFIERTRSDPMTLDRGFGVYAFNAPSVTIERTAIVENRFSGIHILGTSAQCDVHDSLFEGTLLREFNKAEGEGVITANGAKATLSHVAIMGNRAAGIGAAGPADPGVVVISESIIADTKPDGSDIPWGGMGATAIWGATLDVRRCAIVDNHHAGVRSLLKTDMGVPSQATITNTLIRGTRVPPNNPRLGVGVLAVDQGRIFAEGTVIYQNHSCGIFAYNGATISMKSGLIEDTLPQPETHQDGFGLGAYLASTFDIDNSAVMDNVVGGIGVGYSAVGAEPSRVRNSIVSGTKAGSAKEENGMLQSDFGDGIVAAYGGDLEVERTIVEKNARAGFFYFKSIGSVLQCEARGNAIGVSLIYSEEKICDPLKNSIDGLNDEDRQVDGMMSMPPLMTGE